MEKKVSMYFTPVDGCNNTLCQLSKSCSVRKGKVRHMDVNLLNEILQDCCLNIIHIERLSFAVRGNSQVYMYAGDIDLGRFSSRCIMSYTYPYPKDNYPANMCKTYRIDTVNDIRYLVALPDFWDREITKLYTVVSKNNINDVADILYMTNELRGKRTFLYTVNSIKREPSLFVDEKAILPLLEKYQYKKMGEHHLTSCRKNGLNITVDYLGRAQLCVNPEGQNETAFKWTDFEDVYRRILESFKISEKCARCLRKKKTEWRYAIS